MGRRIAIGIFVFLIIFVAIMWWGWDFMLVDGVTRIADGFKAEPTDGGNIAIGLLKIILIPISTGAAIWISGLIGGAVGVALGASNKPKRRNGVSAHRAQFEWDEFMKQDPQNW